MTERIKKELLARLDKRLNEVVDGKWGGAGDLLLDVAASRIAELEEENKQLKVDARSDADVIRRLRERIKEPTP